MKRYWSCFGGHMARYEADFDKEPIDLICKRIAAAFNSYAVERGSIYDYRVRLECIHECPGPLTGEKKKTYCLLVSVDGYWGYHCTAVRDYGTYRR